MAFVKKEVRRQRKQMMEIVRNVEFVRSSARRDAKAHRKAMFSQVEGLIMYQLWDQVRDGNWLIRYLPTLAQITANPVPLYSVRESGAIVLSAGP